MVTYSPVKLEIERDHETARIHVGRMHRQVQASCEVRITSSAPPCQSTSPFSIFFDGLSHAECSDFADQSARQRLLHRELNRATGCFKSREITPERFDRGGSWIKADMMLMRRKCHQDPSVGERGHPPLQTLYSPRSGGSNHCTHLPQLLSCVYPSGADVFSRRSWLHFGRDHFLFNADCQSVTSVMGGCSVLKTPGRRKFLPSGLTSKSGETCETPFA